MSHDSVVDPRALRFGAALTAVVLALALVLPSPAREIVLAVQTVVFALGVFVSLSASPWSWLFRTVVRPRVGAPDRTEDARPPRFAQAVGLTFALVGLVALLTGATTVGLVAVGFAFVAALLNATTGFCLGCELYLTTRRLARTLA
ncbi:DUF4395 domain-containing protein [Aeromicrobium duanguangcaii]|uniref:DUF4395 domain-containing protein n=1 Tax=Aeromicrobium duanguangcaii TaxID=2968086 RepID=A0ABY5KIB5_9ACTN|nr:DUF4395 domain-containing protein [Aeromicrobium duanguangcaii]MCD9154131.1 DUF4395 domain-containing protein [Aeromicrobium duanguangcaii]UUI68796.1 DUF4395 domain-containing protein [Aeromicrobium duanguangcaii]